MSTTFSLAPMTSFNSAFSSRNVYLVINTLIVAIMVGVFFYRVGLRQDQISMDLQDRANQVALRVSKSVKPTLWNIYQKSIDRKYTEKVSSAILDSELSAEYLKAVVVYGNFAHVFMGRKKSLLKEIQTFNKEDRSLLITRGFEHISVPVRQGKMTIGSVSVFFNLAYNSSQLQSIRIGEFIQGGLLTFIFIFIFNVTRKAQLSKIAAEEALIDLKIAQEQLIEAEKMAALGSLVAGVAHEINTPLGVSLTANSLIEECAGKIQGFIAINELTKEKLMSNILDIINATELSVYNLNRVSKLVETFKELAADHSEGEVRSINVRDYIRQTMRTLSITLYENNVEFVLLPGEDIEIITVPLALSQVISSLTGNAIKHGFSDKTQGVLTINFLKVDAHNIQVHFQDDGVGMSQEVVTNIFEPFYTTTRHTGGVGLDMNIVYNIINKNLAGKIRVISTLGTGSNFIITLPIDLAVIKSKHPSVKA